MIYTVLSLFRSQISVFNVTNSIIILNTTRGNSIQIDLDTLDHNILKIGLTNIGICVISLDWLVDFIINRSFSIKLYDNPMFLNYGVPDFLIPCYLCSTFNDLWRTS